MQLFLVRDGVELPAVSLGSSPVGLGRSTDNDLVIDDPTVSGHHATVWIEGGRAWIRDLGSRNGTFVGDERVRQAELGDGSGFRLGAIALVVRGRVPSAGRATRAWLLEDVDSGLRWPFRGTRLVVGPGENADVRLEVSDEDEAALTSDDGAFWRASLSGEGPVEVGEVFEIGDRHLRVIEAADELAQTVDYHAPGHGYRLEVTLDGVSGPEAIVSDPNSGRRHIVDAENRAVLLYLLAKAHAQPSTEAPEGWCADDEVSVGIWGRRGTSDANSLHVLVHRLRKELKQAGFEPWFLEKRRKAIRLSLEDVVVR